MFYPRKVFVLIFCQIIYVKIKLFSAVKFNSLIFPAFVQNCVYVLFDHNSVPVLETYNRIRGLFNHFDKILVYDYLAAVKSCKLYHNFSLSARRCGGGQSRPAAKNHYLLRFTSSSSIESDVVIILAFAWNPLCAVIISVNS